MYAHLLSSRALLHCSTGRPGKGTDPAGLRKRVKKPVAEPVAGNTATLRHANKVFEERGGGEREIRAVVDKCL